jgi:ribosomal protein S27E
MTPPGAPPPPHHPAHQAAPPTPAHQPVPPPQAQVVAETHHTIDTANTRLDDGINRCPACGSTDVQLRASSSKLMCLFCRHEWSEQQIESIVATGDISELAGTHVASGASDIAAGAADVMTLKCGGCGSEVVVNLAESTSSRCHWCRHVLTINEQVPNGAVPDAVLPFSLTRDQALASIREFAGKRRFFADRRFLAEFTPENVVGVYMPYMVVDSNVSADVHGEGEVLTRTHDNGDSPDTYDADVYRVERHVDFTVDDLTIESSDDRADMNTLVNTNNVINTILPFDTKEAVQWNANYLTGFTSEKRDKDIGVVQPVLEHQLLSIARSEIYDSTSQYDRGVRWETERLDLHGSRWVAMYLPVWLYSYYHEAKGKGMVHYIAVNGRTGETMGSVPVSHWRLLLVSLIAGIIIEILAVLIVVAAA